MDTGFMSLNWKLRVCFFALQLHFILLVKFVIVIDNGELAAFKADANEEISAGIVWAKIMIYIYIYIYIYQDSR